MLNDGVTFPLIISAGSGTGKTTVVHELARRNPKRFHISISATTRPPRGGERNGVDYHFFDERGFSDLVDGGDLVEWALVHDFYYGTMRAEIETAKKEGRFVLLDIDIQGGHQIMSTLEDAVSIFLLPPSMEELQNRLRNRGTEDELRVGVRMRNAEHEIREGTNTYDYLVVNDNLESCVKRAEEIIAAEQSRRWRILARHEFRTLLTEDR